ncbi:Hypothetical protein (Fragment) [Durusdinium trenchii]|uniref:C3H1-type domain-containing protein n=1 Tax=Durusdinium trenchii TaxID=1381693 RepID=A0ABP0I521_9DINO
MAAEAMATRDSVMQAASQDGEASLDKKEKKEKKKEKKDRKDKKEKEDKPKKPKKEKRKMDDQAVVEVQRGSDSSSVESMAPPTHNHKTRLCSPFLEGRCHKGSLCTAAHSQSELRKPGEAVAEYREKHPQSGRVSKGAGKGREEALRAPPSRMRAWPQDAPARSRAPARPVGIPMDPMMMGHPGPIMVLPPEMIHMQVPQFHPQVAMMMDPYGFMMPQERHHPKKEKDSKEKEKKKKETERVKVKQKDTPEVKVKKDKTARHKEKVPIQQVKRKERKVDEEDL